MPRRYLFGPVNARFADQCLHEARQRGECIAFDVQDGCDLTIGLTDSWDDVCSRLPTGWQPDFVVLSLPYRIIPHRLWSAPVPIIGLAGDWNLLWHYYRRCLPMCDLVLTDTLGVETMQRAGMNHGRAGNLYGFERCYLETPLSASKRDIDILFVGNFNSAQQRERLPWLARLGALADRWNVVLTTGVYHDDYRALLARSRIVFNRSIRGECNQRAFEATAAGALLFQEADNREVPDYYEAGKEYIAYHPADIETLLAHYLEHEDERIAIAEAGRRRAQQFSFANLWQLALQGLDDELSALPKRPHPLPAIGEALLMRTWQLLGCSPGADPSLPGDLRRELTNHPRSAALHHALAITLAHAAQAQPTSDVSAAVHALRQILHHDPKHVLAGLNLAELLTAAGQAEPAIDQARQSLTELQRRDRLSSDVLDAPHLPAAFDHFRVEWERAAWSNAGQPDEEETAKRSLLHWRSHALLATLTGEIAHYYEATLARPDLPTTRAALGCALARADKFTEAVPHLLAAVRKNPFDAAAARALFGVLGEVGNAMGQRELIDDRRLLAQAAPTIVPNEPWFKESRPLGDELASIIILCCNQLEFTKQCLESVLDHTRTPYELLLIDNGSTDGTPAYLEELRHRSGPQRVAVIRNDTNRGFAAGCNQGLEASRGQYLVLLNNDTIVTNGWLAGLIAWSLHEWPNVGLVGPVASWASPPQQVTVKYRSPEELHAFAAKRRQEFAGKVIKVERLTGFCLLFRRDVWEKLGGLDEGFGLGFFEDDDLCVRVREGGYKLLMVPSVFIHHYGNRTFNGLGLDANAHLQANFEKFRAKWGDERCAGYRLAETSESRDDQPSHQKVSYPPRPCGGVELANADTAASPPEDGGQRASVSLCMIVKNEEHHLGACLRSVADLVDEMIVVDTGSSDRTKEIAQQAGAQVFDFHWVDSFTAARNESLRHAKGQWIFWLDADEQLDQTNRQRLRKLFADLKDENVAYVMRQFSKLEVATHAAAQVDQVRLFRNRPDIRWEYRVHEQILLSVRRSGGDVRLTDIVIDHSGFSEPEVQGAKVDRNLRLLELELVDHPDDSFVLYNLGAVRLTQGESGLALDFFRRSLKNARPGDVLVRKLHALIARAHHQLGQKEEALAACRNALHEFPEDGELLFWEAMLLREQKDLAGAASSLERVLKARPSQHFTSVDAGLYGYRARQFLGEVYRDLGRSAEAEAQWRAAVTQCPNFTPAWLELAKQAFLDSRWPELDEALMHLENDPQSAVEALVLRGRSHLVRKRFAAAKVHLRAAICKAPEALLPSMLLSHALLQEGLDWAGAEQALLHVLELEPHHEEALHNLGVLRQQHPELVSGFNAADENYVVGDDSLASAANGSPPKVSLCMIVRNEELNLPGCLDSVADLVDEIVVVDTGSTDDTKEIALKRGAKVFDFPWVDSFAAARNESLKHASGQWVFWLDADDRLDDENRAKLRELFSKLTNQMAGYVMKCLCLPDGNGTETVVDHMRLFRNHPRARWTFRVHEQILPALRSLKADVRWSDVVIHHTGYQDASARQRKLERDLRLLQLEQAEQPDHPFTLFNLGSVYQELGRTAEALQVFQRSLDSSEPTDSIVRKLYALIAQCHRTLGQKQEALEVCRKGLNLYADDIELLFQEGVALRELGDTAGAIDCWERCLATPRGEHFASVNTGLAGHITRHNLASAYCEMGRPVEAESQWKAALQERRHYEPAWRGLIALFLERKQWSKVEVLAHEFEQSQGGGLNVAVIRGRLHLAQKQFDKGRRLLEDAIQDWPRALEPRILLSHTLLQQGEDWPAAERTLRAILELDPEQREAKHNLAILLHQRAIA